ncbi:MAG: hypothetical protein QXI19_04600 [Candidatus Caldarchaeum sp.]
MAAVNLLSPLSALLLRWSGNWVAVFGQALNTDPATTLSSEVATS